MPGWSPEIANEFIRLASADGRTLDQLQLQALVYIAHGWQLALSGQPLSGDRPEAMEFGPTYRRLSDVLARYGREKVTSEILVGEVFPEALPADRSPIRANLDHSETALIADIYHNYGALESWQLSALTRKGDTPWKRVFAEGAGTGCDIPHEIIRAQFVELLRQSENPLQDG